MMKKNYAVPTVDVVDVKFEVLMVSPAAGDNNGTSGVNARKQSYEAGGNPWGDSSSDSGKSSSTNFLD